MAVVVTDGARRCRLVAGALRRVRGPCRLVDTKRIIRVCDTVMRVCDGADALVDCALLSQHVHYHHGSDTILELSLNIISVLSSPDPPTDTDARL